MLKEIGTFFFNAFFGAAVASVLFGAAGLIMYGVFWLPALFFDDWSLAHVFFGGILSVSFVLGVEFAIDQVKPQSVDEAKP